MLSTLNNAARGGTIACPMSRNLAFIHTAQRYPDRIAVIDAGRRYSYGKLLDVSGRVAAALLDGTDDLHQQRVAFLAPPCFEYVAAQWGIWRAGGIAVPLGLQHPVPELEHVIDDADVSAVVVHPDFDSKLQPIIGPRTLRVLDIGTAMASEPVKLPSVEAGRRAMIVYTSGTTGRPKGAVTTHANIEAQASALIEAWEWSPDDHILNVLPMHHVHGIVNMLECALMSGAACEFMSFDAASVWDRFAKKDLTLFMAVPTIYSKLISTWENADEKRRSEWSDGCRGMRLMVSGSAALPVTTLGRWHQITGHVLLERYGMTEIGMALSNPLHGARRPGFVGTPLPRVQLRLADEAGNPAPAGEPGQIQVRGPAVFLEYWRQKKATEKEFRDGWFCTGDVALFEEGAYRILGRTSVDIIKTGGHKVSALEVEEVLRTHPGICECAVVGVEDAEWGQRVAVAVVTKSGAELTLSELRSWARDRLAEYKIPSLLKVVDRLPRNAMGKVHKPTVTGEFSGS